MDNHFVRVLRPEQYYKNLVIFLALFFSGNLLNPAMLPAVALGFIALCGISSANYILNDIADRKRDKAHAEKATRPIAAETISVTTAAGWAAVLAVLSLWLAYTLGAGFFIAAAGLLLSSSLYTFLLRNEAFADIITIAVNFVIRALAGALIIKVWISPWLVVGTFFLALFLASGKRRAELFLLGKKAVKHRTAFTSYSEELLNFLLQTSTTSLILAYTLYSFLGNNERLLFTLPVVLYLMLRYLHLIYSGARESHIISSVFHDRRMLIGMLLYALLSFGVLYGPAF